MSFMKFYTMHVVYIPKYFQDSLCTYMHFVVLTCLSKQQFMKTRIHCKYNPAFIFMRFFVDKKPCSTVTRTVFVPESIVHCTTAYTCALRLLKAEELPCAYASPVLFYTFTCAPYRRKSVDAFLKWHSLGILSFELSYITLVWGWTTLHCL